MTPPHSPTPPHGNADWRVSGKWFRDVQGNKLFLNGVTYGPFRPNSRDEPWPEDERTASDFRHIAEMGFNTVRVYDPPSRQILDIATAQGLRLLVGVPWIQHVDFLADKRTQEDTREKVRQVARTLAQEPAVAALIIGNEIEKTLVRWMKPERVRHFLEGLVAIAQQEAPRKPVAYASYPSTEYLIPRNADFLAFNIYLEDQSKFAAYVQRLQNLAGGKPLIISEFGFDTLSHGAEAQAAALRWERQTALDAGAAGNFWFSYTDEWFRGGEDVQGWKFGLVTSDRVPKPACAVARNLGLPATFAGEVHGHHQEARRFSAIVCTRNGAHTLRSCLQGLSRQSWPNYEVIVIDDGSSDATPEIARSFDFVRYYRQDHAGLSAARNWGMELATGEVLAYTDDDCIPDEDWLRHLNPVFDDPAWVAAGGPNLPPPPRNLTEACVAAAPGAPAHVLLDDIEAEHLPGCNLAIRKSALQAIGGFRTEYTTAGDDVDVCWRLQLAGGKLRFMAAAIVWHHRRFTLRAYLKQQTGYGRAEAMLIRGYPERFAWFCGAKWRGAIYGDETIHGELSRQAIHFGPQGLAPFQCIYTQDGSSLAHWLSGLPWLAGTGLAAVLAVVHFGWMIVAGVMLLLAVNVARHRANLNDFMLLHRTRRHRALLWLLCFLQPIVRDWARIRGMVALRAWPKGKWHWSFRRTASKKEPVMSECQPLLFWSEGQSDRRALLAALPETLAQSPGSEFAPVGAWSLWDAQIKWRGQRFAIAAVSEYHGQAGSLTRVKLAEPFWSWLDAFCWAGLLLQVISLFPLPGEFWLLVSGFILFLGAYIFKVSATASLRRQVIRAAAQSGLKLCLPTGSSRLPSRPAGMSLPMAGLDSHQKSCEVV